jgi:hypothetical protein
VLEITGLALATRKMPATGSHGGLLRVRIITGIIAVVLASTAATTCATTSSGVDDLNQMAVGPVPADTAVLDLDSHVPVPLPLPLAVSQRDSELEPSLRASARASTSASTETHCRDSDQLELELEDSAALPSPARPIIASGSQEVGTDKSIGSRGACWKVTRELTFPYSL